ncbi:hypothetical protein [Cohnella rhizosphaerae]|uniref:Uncharacterized protein n=1 Tax=Cohnella rhizosphaerae TaxID=1457232 RepID=A0A9X4L180_9BACL|nr:hypothetical protein [Cohnella rhizosphaerae]MDG0814261.1 hypothetical protein [Cohnella rhizosphaerae]
MLRKTNKKVDILLLQMLGRRERLVHRIDETCADDLDIHLAHPVFKFLSVTGELFAQSRELLPIRLVPHRHDADASARAPEMIHHSLTPPLDLYRSFLS